MAVEAYNVRCARCQTIIVYKYCRYDWDEMIVEKPRKRHRWIFYCSYECRGKHWHSAIR